MARADRVLSLSYEPRAECLHVFPGDHPQEQLRGAKCAWTFRSSPLARNNAKEHTKITGHNTLVVRETVDEYAQAGA